MHGPREDSIHITYSGLYEFKKIPFGLVDAPATFQKLMEVLWNRLVGDECMRGVS